jgi:UDP-N-acetylmuramoylalanine--D-glutamate ligase
MAMLSGKHVVVVGLGKSGIAAARLALREGARVTLNDVKSEAELGALATEARSLGASLHLGDHPVSLFTSADCVVLSPGVPRLAAVDAARAAGVRVMAEVELAAPFLKGRVVGITGSNGKSTVTTLVGEMAKATGQPTFMGGNLGDALSNAAFTPAASPEGFVVAELSSFQLEELESLRCHVAVLLNVTDDHLDRHGTFADYAAAKGRIFHPQTKADHALVPDGDEICLALARAGAGRVHTFWGKNGEVRVENGVLVDTGSDLRFPIRDLRIRGLHNQSNACAAALSARLLGIDASTIARVLREFAGLPHRMVHVRDLDGVAYYDDSKATNVGAACAALDGLADLDGKVVLVAGGVDKQGSYAPLRERMEARGRAVVVIGEARPIIHAAFAGSSLSLVDASTIDDAAEKARALAKPGDAVLLAPACASFDMFKGYAHRGDEFQRAVRALPAAGVSR